MIQKVSIDSIQENPDNPRLIDQESFNKLKKSLLDFPDMLQIRPIIIDEHGFILGGNMRFKAAQDLGFKEVWVQQANLSPAQKKEFIIKDNNGYGDWDFEFIKTGFTFSELKDWGLEIPEWFQHEGDLKYEDPLPGEEHQPTHEVLILNFSQKEYDAIVQELTRKKKTLQSLLKELYV